MGLTLMRGIPRSKKVSSCHAFARLLVVGTLALAAGCASSTGIVPVGNDIYMVSRHGGFGSANGGPIKADAFREAAEYCSEKGKQFQPISTHETPLAPGRFPEAEVQFTCLSPGESLPKNALAPMAPAQKVIIEKIDHTTGGN